MKRIVGNFQDLDKIKSSLLIEGKKKAQVHNRHKRAITLVTRLLSEKYEKGDMGDGCSKRDALGWMMAVTIDGPMDKGIDGYNT